MENQTVRRNPWIDRYVAEVGRMLPPAKRADVELEMRSLIEEEVEARAARDGGSGEELVLDVLKTFGRPQEIAARYGAQQYLIGPVLYPVFLTVLRIVTAVLLGVTLFGLAVAIGVEQARPNPFEVAGDLFGAWVQGAGMVVLVFALIERLNRAALQKEAAADWDPRSLPEIEDRDRVKVGETIAGIAFGIVALVMLNVYLERSGIRLNWEDGGERIPLFSESFYRYVPLLSLWWGLDILLNVLLLLRGRWTTWLRLADVAVQAVGVAVLSQMLVGPPLAAWPPVEPAFRITVAIILAFTLFEAGRHLWVVLARRLGHGGAPPLSMAR